ncbi:MAG: thiopurine S-methyltransferase [Woeseia sp.]|nr:thiopurine S-methyltransferase [Woeseia sp.]NNE60947.1 thiopurine S-methyltransferase [Woeseia sp.]NNL53977.1 thiopurine S-methyltransferase [Woeseia sp.]
MESDFWHERWANNQIGFHQDVTTPLLERHWDELFDSSVKSVFVPLCGKSRDLLWLAERGLEVVGVELSQTAVESFFAEQKLDARRGLHGEMREYRCASLPLTVYQGDFFALSNDVFVTSDVVFDRGALIALPRIMRRAYVEKFKSKLKPEARILLMTLEHSDEKSPPFSVQESEIRDLYEDEFSVKRIDEEPEEFRGQLATNVIYLLNRKQPVTL